MTWLEARVVVPAGDVQRASAQLFLAGAAGVQEDFLPGEAPPPRQPWDRGSPPPLPPRRLVRAWFEDPDRDAVEATVTDAIAWEAVPDVDWDAQWKAGFTAVRISDRLTFGPPWDAPAGAVIIEPGQGFGTGQHPTTLAALRMLDEIASPGERCLDVGCGSGILALAAARLGLEAQGIDNDPVAVTDANGNAARNDLVVPFSTTPLSALQGTWEVVLANLFAEVLVALRDDLVRVSGRDLVLAGILADREPAVRAAFDPALPLADRHADGEWVALRYRR